MNSQQTAPVYIRRDIHAKLKARAGKEQKPLYELINEILLPLVARNGKGKSK